MNKKEFKRLQGMFLKCSPLFIALGDEIRQKIMLEVSESGFDGINVTELASRFKLSRPAVSHHLKVLKDSGLLVSVKKGTQMFYRAEFKKNLQVVDNLIHSVLEVVEAEEKLRLQGNLSGAGSLT
ncbi:helix-turn-helix transcriptional regulator [Treponema sp.]|uniref:ArsR/SmtB family transcription factor n=1 Tax=Treponema sp. TaxID=166 RepID=UPI0025F67A09|nr:metalloregulator ArsR/SmtB family transcription factor [Treponema sp.]MCR5218227.1 metalloregulator ArsR/SmtB family transcription factor [Treponema sp.]